MWHVNWDTRHRDYNCAYLFMRCVLDTSRRSPRIHGHVLLIVFCFLTTIVYLGLQTEWLNAECLCRALSQCSKFFVHFWYRVDSDCFT
jgi:hypothetical protein